MSPDPLNDRPRIVHETALYYDPQRDSDIKVKRLANGTGHETVVIL